MGTSVGEEPSYLLCCREDRWEKGGLQSYGGVLPDNRAQSAFERISLSDKSDSIYLTRIENIIIVVTDKSVGYEVSQQFLIMASKLRSCS